MTVDDPGGYVSALFAAEAASKNNAQKRITPLAILASSDITREFTKVSSLGEESESAWRESRVPLADARGSEALFLLRRWLLDGVGYYGWGAVQGLQDTVHVILCFSNVRLRGRVAIDFLRPGVVSGQR
jgi:hypothetical protein